MANTPVPKIRPALPNATKMPLGNFIQSLNVSGMTPEQMAGTACAIQSGRGGLPVGTGKS